MNNKILLYVIIPIALYSRTWDFGPDKPFKHATYLAKKYFEKINIEECKTTKELKAFIKEAVDLYEDHIVMCVPTDMPNGSLGYDPEQDNASNSFKRADEHIDETLEKIETIYDYTDSLIENDKDKAILSDLFVYFFALGKYTDKTTETYISQFRLKENIFPEETKKISEAESIQELKNYYIWLYEEIKRIKEIFNISDHKTENFIESLINYPKENIKND